MSFLYSAFNLKELLCSYKCIKDLYSSVNSSWYLPEGSKKSRRRGQKNRCSQTRFVPLGNWNKTPSSKGIQDCHRTTLTLLYDYNMTLFPHMLTSIWTQFPCTKLRKGAGAYASPLPEMASLEWHLEEQHSGYIPCLPECGLPPGSCSYFLHQGWLPWRGQ